MDLQTRKILFVQSFLKFQSDQVIEKFEKLLKSINSESEHLTIKELNDRIDKSLLDSSTDKVTEVYKLLSEVEEWKKVYFGLILLKRNPPSPRLQRGFVRKAFVKPLFL